MPADPLAGLRDLHMPPPPTWWPPAPGWWILTAVALVTSVAATAVLIRRHRLARPVRAALVELDAIFTALDDSDKQAHCAQSVSTLLKRVALLRYPRTEVAALAGEHWVTFLQRTAPRNTDPAAVEPLVQMYAIRVESDTGALHQFSRRWLLHHRYRVRHHADV